VTAIQINQLTKKFKYCTAVDSLNLSIQEGEFFALLGENGAGKTTTIKMLCCLLSPTSGGALLLGHSILHDATTVKQKINVSPQETAIAPNLTVKENLELIANIYGIDQRELKGKADNMLVKSGLSDRAKDRAKTLSGGLQRRLSIAMALISDPKIIFLDEPTIGLDVRARRELWKTLTSLKGVITTVLTTHYLEEAEALADRIGIMHRGKLRLVGNAQHIKEETGTATLEDAFLKVTETETT
jgi:ABC-2 type transport system ATP-binding protein